MNKKWVHEQLLFKCFFWIWMKQYILKDSLFQTLTSSVRVQPISCRVNNIPPSCYFGGKNAKYFVLRNSRNWAFIDSPLRLSKFISPLPRPDIEGRKPLLYLSQLRLIAPANKFGSVCIVLDIYHPKICQKRSKHHATFLPTHPFVACDF